MIVAELLNSEESGSPDLKNDLQYILKSNTQTALLTLGRLKHRIDVNTLDHLPAKTLELNEIGVCNISLDKRIAFDSYENNREFLGVKSLRGRRIIPRRIKNIGNVRY